MKKPSTVKIITALLIADGYLFSCGIAGTIGSPTAITEAEAMMVRESYETESGTAESDAAEGQGTLDFLVPDETATGYVQISLLNMAHSSLAEKAVQSTCTIQEELIAIPAESGEGTAEPEETDAEAEETADEPEIATEETAESPTDEPASDSDAASSEESDDAEEQPPQTTAATTTAAPATTAQAAPQTTAPPATVATTASTTSAALGGIPVDADSATASSPQPSPAESSEILYVRNNGATVSGGAPDIVSRVTQSEVGHSFADEAIKAQAVAVYSYIKFCNEYGTYPSVILADSVSSKVESLVESVIGEAIYYNGSVIQAVYSASSAGYTASSMTVWGTNYPYLQSRYCELDEKYDPNYGVQTQYSSAEIKSIIEEKTGITLSGDPSEWLSIEEHIDGNYVGQMNIGGYHSYTDSDGDTVKITGRVFRERIMSYGIRSSAFDVSYDSGTDTFTFTTYGYGHGVGMSQNGANALATYLGYNYKQILTFYYQGTEVK